MTQQRLSTGKRVGYVRVSSVEQNPARQLEALGECDKLFTDRASGKSSEGRPQLAALLDYVREDDHVVCSSMDRLARSVTDLNAIVQQITGEGASIEFLHERLTFTREETDPFAQFQLNLMASFAQFERELIRQRQAEGIAAAKARGAYKGRPRKLNAAQLKQLRTRALAGESKKQLMKDYGISRSTLYRSLEQSSLPLQGDSTVSCQRSSEDERRP